MTPSPFSHRLTQLRAQMTRADVDYYLVPGSDPHKNEYVPSHWQRRAWISGFTGSAGEALVSQTHAFLWTDARYFLQAEKELDRSLYTLVKSQGGIAPIEAWLLTQPDGFTLAVDPKVITVHQVQRLTAVIQSKKGHLLLIEENWIDALWSDRPTRPNNPIQPLAIEYSGLAAKDKLAILREQLREKQLTAFVVSALDAIAWLFNIRGRDIPYNPLVISYALITQEHAFLFTDQPLSLDGLTVLPYDAFGSTLQKQSGFIGIDPQQASGWIEQQIINGTPFYQTSPLSLSKAIKNKVEQEGMRQAHIFDGIAMIRFLHWLETHWREGITELSAAQKLNALRLENPHCVDLSFTTISGFAAHGAIVHYAVSEESNIPIDDSSLYLVDSGGQYYLGTTDVTRTLHLGNPTPEQRHHYTLVLKGHLSLRQLVFPCGTCGEHINAFAHAPLWQEGLDYGHGTGHGVGHYACVHEFPPAISARQTNEPLRPGMIVSNEPGFYREGHYGIRIENLCLVKTVFTHPPFYGFEDLTLVPYCKKLIKTELLTTTEITAINHYHETLYLTLKPYLKETTLIDWLQKNTRPLLHF